MESGDNVNPRFPCLVCSILAPYTDADIIDTGVYDCYSEAYVEQAQINADLIRCSLNYVQGSNIILEKLVSGNWDAQFVVAEPGTKIQMKDFKLEAIG